MRGAAEKQTGTSNALGPLRMSVKVRAKKKMLLALTEKGKKMLLAFLKGLTTPRKKKIRNLL